MVNTSCDVPKYAKDAKGAGNTDVIVDSTRDGARRKAGAISLCAETSHQSSEIVRRGNAPR